MYLLHTNNKYNIFIILSNFVLSVVQKKTQAYRMVSGKQNTYYCQATTPAPPQQCDNRAVKRRYTLGLDIHVSMRIQLKFI